MSLTDLRRPKRETDPEEIPLRKPTTEEIKLSEYSRYKAGTPEAAYNTKVLDAAKVRDQRQAAAKSRYDTQMGSVGKNYEHQQSLADSQHSAALRQQAQQRADTKREAYIAHERLQRYLPQARAVSGIEGMGMTETAKTNALNAYLGQRSAADAAYAGSVADLDAAKELADTERRMAQGKEEQALLQNYLDTKQAAENEYINQKQTAADKLAAERRAATEKAEAEKQALAESKSAAVLDGASARLNMALASGEDGKLSPSDYNDLMNYIDGYRGLLTEGDRVRLETMLGAYSVRTEEEQAALEAELAAELSPEEKAEAEGLSANAVSLVLDRYNYMAGEDGKISKADYETLRRYAEGLSGRMTDADKAGLEMTLEAYRDFVRDDDTQATLDKMGFKSAGVALSGGTSYGTGISEFTDGNNFTVKDGSGREYMVQLDAPGDAAVTDAAVISAADKTRRGDIFAYGGRLYLNNGSEVYAIKKRKGKKELEDWNALWDLFFEKNGSDQVQSLEAYASNKNSTEKKASTAGGQGRYRGRN